MYRNIIFVLMYHRHRVLDLIVIFIFVPDFRVFEIPEFVWSDLYCGQPWKRCQDSGVPVEIRTRISRIQTNSFTISANFLCYQWSNEPDFLPSSTSVNTEVRQSRSFVVDGEGNVTKALI
jgi:hypothetical protein